MKVYDCFTFFNELDLLEIRLNVLNEVVDKFVLVEATKTHAGKDKPLYFQENKERFSRFLDKIVHVVVDDYPPYETSWTYENHQRNCILRGLTEIRPEDDIIISDLDEIPDPAVILKWRGTKGIKRFDERMFYYFLNYQNVITPEWCLGTKMLSYQTFLDSDSADYTYTDTFLESINQGPTFTKIRFAKPDKIVHHAGWHFSYLGGVDAIQFKLKSFAHQEHNTPETTTREYIEKCLASGGDLFNRGDRYLPVRIDRTFPAYIREHVNEFPHLIRPVNTKFFSHENRLRLHYRVKGRTTRIFRFLYSYLTPPFIRRVYRSIKGKARKA